MVRQWTSRRAVVLYGCVSLMRQRATARGLLACSWPSKPFRAIGMAFGSTGYGVLVLGLALGPPTPTDLIFQHDSGKPWTSYYFCHHFVYPALRAQVTEGDAYLIALTKGGGTLESKFWSMHFFRWGARSHATRGGRYGRHRFRKATKDQIYEHGRWRRRRSSEIIHVLYRESTFLERLQLTLLSM
jgi:hypothetical protein